MNNDGMRELFLQEAGEILTVLETDLLDLEERSDRDTVDEIFRQVHTLKGGAGMVGFRNIYEFTHRLESVLDMVRTGCFEADADLVDVMLKGVDWIRGEMSEAPDHGGDELKARLLERLADLAAAKGIPLPDPKITAPAARGNDAGPVPIAPKEDGRPRTYRIKAGFRPDVFFRGIDPLLTIMQLNHIGTVRRLKVDKRALPDFDSMDPETCYLGWEMELESDRPRREVEDIFMFVRDESTIEIEDLGKIDEASALGDVSANPPDAASGPDATAPRIGDILVSGGVLSEEELEMVLQEQRSSSGKIGDLAVRMGFATEKDVRAALGEQEKCRKRAEVSTVRVDTSKLDSLLNLLGEIVIGQSAVTRIAEELDEERALRFKSALYALERTTRVFQEQIMSIRMIPIGPTFEHFRRFVRETAKGLGKDIRLEYSGGETELDKTVIEMIGDPLKHMIRNALDHGIETADERRMAGKPEAGTVALRAYHQEGTILIEIEDDGRGLDRRRIREKAEKLGLIGPSEDVGDTRLFSFLFNPGFSTAEKVGELSGRGVGLDVVRTNVESLRGTVELSSNEGRGTLFRIKLPLTLAIIEGMLIRVGSNVYILPLLSIVESVRPGRDELKTIEGRGEVIHVRGEYLSLIRLGGFFGVDAEFADPWESLVVVVESGGSRAGLMVDELLGQQQIVIKSLESYITAGRAVSGAAILGDGHVALIIDVHGLISDIREDRRH